MQEASIGLAIWRPTRGGMYLLFNPVILTYFLKVDPRLDLGPDGFVAFVTADGRLLNTVGSPPPRPL